MTFASRFIVVAALLPLSSAFAMDPPEGSIDENNSTASSTGGPYFAANPSPQTGEPICTAADCDEYLLNVDFSAGFRSANPNFQVRYTVGWDGPADDIDVYLYDNATDEIIGQSASSSNPEVIQMSLANTPDQVRVVLVLFNTAGRMPR